MAVYVLSENDKRLIENMRRHQESMRGPGITNQPHAYTSRTTPERSRGSAPLFGVFRFSAMLTGNAALAGSSYRWKYAWSAIEDSGDGVQTITDGLSGTTDTDYALNYAEMYHTSTYAWGIDVTGTDYDGTTSFAPRPIGGGGAADTHRYNVPVEMIRKVDVNGTSIYRFYAFGSHDGAC